MASAALGQQITVYSSGNLPIGQAKQLTAYVPLAVNTVTWSVNGVMGGDSTYGTVSATGLYKAPMTVPANNAVTVQATSTADSAKFGVVTITITQPPVQLWSISPTSAPVGAFTIQLNGANFAANSVVNLGGVALTTTLLSSTGLRATGVTIDSQVGTNVPVTVTNSGLGGTTSTPVNLAVTVANPVTVKVAPATASVSVSTTRQFNATVTGSMNTAVTWSVNGMAGGNSTVGSISASGLYTAPAAVPNPATVTIQAASVATPSSTASATVTIQPPAPPPVIVTVAPSNVIVAPGATQLFTANYCRDLERQRNRRRIRGRRIHFRGRFVYGAGRGAESSHCHDSRHQHGESVLRRERKREYRRSAESGDRAGDFEFKRRALSRTGVFRSDARRPGARKTDRIRRLAGRAVQHS